MIEDNYLICTISAGKMIYVALTEEVARTFDMQLEGDAPDIDSNEENVATADESVDLTKLWTPERTLFLIETIETFIKRLEAEVKKHVWEEISKRCNEILGINITYKQAESKWKSLKRTYKSVLLHNNTSGKNRRHWEYFNKIHCFMYKRPEITPMATCSSFSGLQSKANSNIGTRGHITPTSSSGIASENAILNASNSDFETSTPQSSFSRKRRNRESEVSNCKSFNIIKVRVGTYLHKLSHSL